ncbi:PAS domain-containing protein [Rhodospirillaceae bacterium KN72]|uniref:PAS domain-containing protein n=1 Tax=Pacificispira spongiicola TaxID=2729598 RepID=A0A7Y0DX18_9PROT|nr:PAS domain-containing protein [Pacificispira spongiicola]NMM43140.1 PAS domain-containing protein [Pacificispira spongiicola]
MAWLERYDWRYDLFPFDAPGDCFPRNDRFVALWQSKVVNGAVPARADFQMEELKPWLGWLTILEILDPVAPRARFRLWGSHLAELTRLEMTGKTMQERFGEGSDATHYNAADLEFIREIVTRPCIGLAAGPVDWDIPDYALMSTVRLPISFRGDGIADGIISQVTVS